MRISALQVTNFRSFHGTHQVGPLGPVAALVGPNNAGKSSLFKAVMALPRCKPYAVGPFPHPPEDGYLPTDGALTSAAEITLQVSFSDIEREALARAGWSADDERVYLSVVLVQSAEGVTYQWSEPEPRAPVHVAEFALGRLVHVPAVRRLESESARRTTQIPTFEPVEGRWLKSWLNELHRGRVPHERQARADFIQDVRSISGFEEFEFEVTSRPDSPGYLDVSVRLGGAYHPLLEECGTGLQMVLITLSAVHRRSGTVVLIDEPENDLHPRAQADFANVIARRAGAVDGQVLFATHSPSVLNAVPDSCVFEVRSENGYSTVRALQGAGPLLQTLRDLGYSPSMLRMAETVVFVEGPSDVAVLSAWWRTLFDEEPTPGVAILGLGGDDMARLEVDTVRALGRQIFTVLDSDRSKPDDEPQGKALRFKQRVADAMHVHIWDRRAIENYFAPEAIRTVVSQEAPGPYGRLETGGMGRYKKTDHAGKIAALMSRTEIPEEVVQLLEAIRASAHGKPSPAAPRALA